MGDGSSKTPRIGVVMDPIQGITPYKDSTLAMMLEIQRRGWSLYYLTLADLYLDNGRPMGRYHSITVRDDNHDWFDLGETQEGPLSELDGLLMRKDPPFDMEYIYATYILERAEEEGVRVVNRPASLRDVSEKVYTAWFPECCPPTVITRDRSRLRAFIREQGKAVLKPLDGMGGRDIFILADGDNNTSVVLDHLTREGQRYALVQSYLPAIREGDKRILLVDGHPTGPALARIPAEGESRGNLAAGGRGQGVELSERDHWLCERIGPVMRDKGLTFVGLDVIGDYVTEINVTSPTCIRELDKLYGSNIAGELMDALARQAGWA
ncbi:glutathione synthase [Natronospira proteinivora]|uniref:Glutathione synthetase n=1 Tax=Natronospira proteinivora TaxID=1807133 RepID=A0ABT1GAP5_9GAMM|nr:glutathione synthase [Natronospira proteinivora]MCP1728406.1 glutathione synthase [Natronospira proteinivora]